MPDRWTLRITDTDNFTNVGTFITGVDLVTDDVIVRGGPIATISGDRTPVELTFNARRDLFGAGPRQWVEFAVNDGGTKVFRGPIIICPPANTAGAGNANEGALERYVVGSPRIIMEQTEAAPVFFPDEDTTTLLDQDYAQVAYRLTLRSAPVGISIPVPINIGELCPNFYAPSTSLADALDRLVAQADTDCRWYVNALSQFVFESV